MYLPEGLTLEEKEVVKQLKKNTHNDLTSKMQGDDTIFYRYCKARDFDLAAAEKMLRKTIAWRKENNIDSLTKDDIPEIIWKHIPFHHFGYAKNNCPVYYWNIGGTDCQGLFKSVTMEELVNFGAFFMDCVEKMMREQSKKSNKRITQVIIIHDYTGTSLANLLDKQAAKTLEGNLKTFQDYYPERVNLVFEINAPGYFCLLFNILKVFVASPLLEKVKVFGTNGFGEELLKIVDADVLPSFLGGNRTDPDGDPSCKTLFPPPSEIHPRFHLSSIQQTTAEELNLLPLCVKRSSREEVVLEVKEEGRRIEWRILTGQSDVDVTLRFREHAWDARRSEVLAPTRRLLAVRRPVEGSHKCDKAGIYILEFGNSYSWIYSKRVLFSFYLKEPDVI